MKKRPLRFLRTILIFLLLGAILNVAVAWGCFAVFTFQTDYGQKLGDIEWFVREGGILPEGSNSQRYRPSIGHSNIVLTNYNYGTSYVAEISWIGLPMHSLYGGVFYSDYLVETNTSSGPECFGSWELPYAIAGGNWMGLFSMHYYIPYRPIWLGFIFNTIFYAIPLWLLFPGRYMWRRRRRIQRGLCGQCGYIVSVNAGLPGASPNCTECGTPIHPRFIHSEIVRLKS